MSLCTRSLASFFMFSKSPATARDGVFHQPRSDTGSKEEENIYYTPGQQFELIWRLTRQVMAVWIGVRVSGGKRSVWLVVELQGIRAQKEEEKEKDGSARTRSHNRLERLSHSRSFDRSHLTSQATTARLPEVGTWTIDWSPGIRK